MQNTVGNAKVNHLRRAALFAGHFLGQNVKDLCGGSGMDVLAFLERGRQTDVPVEPCGMRNSIWE